jgi:2-polyprenyl-3-methyl-5-hydroxy-6-metoxy-1,4-benzoquinol methylase
MESNQYLVEHYNRGGEDARLTSKHGSVEFLTTMRYVERYVKPGDRIIEIGAGTGRYSHTLARQGYAVDAVELVPSNIEVFRQNTQPGEQITVTQGNALDLSAFAYDAYDLTLLLGSMYHLYTREDKLQALREAIRVTKPGGVVFMAYCISDASVLDYGFMRGHIFELIEKNMLETEHFNTFSNPWDVFELVRKEDVDALMRDFAVKRLHYVASDGYTNHMQATVDSMDDKTFDLYLRYHFATCEREDMLGLTHHALDIFRKI